MSQHEHVVLICVDGKGQVQAHYSRNHPELKPNEGGEYHYAAVEAAFPGECLIAVVQDARHEHVSVIARRNGEWVQLDNSDKAHMP